MNDHALETASKEIKNGKGMYSPGNKQKSVLIKYLALENAKSSGF